MTGRLAQARSGLVASRSEMQLPVFALLLGAAWLLVAAQLFAEYWAATAVTMPDGDDSMRLVETRQFLSGGLSNWFNLREPRLGLPPGYDTHWSRLIDAGLAALFLSFRIFADTPMAERLMTAAWPVLWLIPAIGGTAAIAWRVAGREAAIVVLLLGVFSGPGIQQFRPGRIDHHNVQIALAILVVAATVWSDRRRWCAAAAGALSALALAIGFEGLPFLALCGAAFALRFVGSAEGRIELRDYGLALAAGMGAVFLLSVPPSRWMAPVCDTIAINSAAAVMITGLGLAFCASIPGRLSRVMRLGLAATPAIAAVIAFALIEPRCLGGHYAMIDPAVRAIWLDNVAETQPLFDLIQLAPATALAIAAFPLAALVAALMLSREKNIYREFGPLTALAALLMAAAYLVAAARGSSYVVWLGMPFVAAALCRLFVIFNIGNLALRFVATLFVTPTAMTVGTMVLASAAGLPELTRLTSPQRAACTSKPNYTSLAALPPGLMAINDFNWGSYMLAWTPHSVLAAPYHRLSSSIVRSHRIFAEPPEKARALAVKTGVAYLVMCGDRGTTGLSDEERRASLWTRLQSGRAPGWLEPVKQDPASVFRVWKVKR